MGYGRQLRKKHCRQEDKERSSQDTREMVAAVEHQTCEGLEEILHCPGFQPCEILTLRGTDPPLYGFTLSK